MVRPILISAAMLLSCLPVKAQAVAQDLYPGAPRGRLYITLEMTGSGRRDLSNKIEWFRLSAERKLNLELKMALGMKSAAPSVKISGTDKDNAPLSPALTSMTKALEACKGDETCQAKAIMEIGKRMAANPQAPEYSQGDTERYENWVSEAQGVCAKGTLTVEDEGDGMNISPPSPAKPYKFKRIGKLDLPDQGAELMNKACQAEVSVDRLNGALSLRLNGLNIPVPVQLTGQAFTSEKSVSFLEGRGKLDLLDQAIDPKASSWSGQGQIEKAGSVSHNSGQTVAPMKANLTWRFVRD